MNTIKHLGAMFAAAALAAVAYADDPPTIDLTFAPGDTLAYSHDGCEPVRIEASESPVTLELERNGHYVFYSNSVVTAEQDVSDLGTTVTEPNWATVPVTFMLDTKVERTFDLSGGVASTNLTYSGTGWDEPGAGTSATIKYQFDEGDEKTLASGLVGTGEIEWKPLAIGTYTLKHTSGDATETATITVAYLTMVTVTSAKQRWPWNGKVDVGYTLSHTEEGEYYRLITAVTVGGTTKQVTNEVGAVSDGNYKTTVDCAALFGADVLAPASITMAVMAYSAPAEQDVSDLGTKVTEPNWATVPVTFMLDTKMERTFDLSGGVVTTNLTYSGTGWDEPGAGTSATIKYQFDEGDETTLASGLVGTGERPWTPTSNGTYTLTHTSGDATETATITVENLTMVTITVGDLSAKHLTAKVVWHGIETLVTGSSFELPKGGRDAKLVLTAEKGYRPDGSLGTASRIGDGRWMVEVPLDDLIVEGGTLNIQAAVAYCDVQLLSVTNRYPWNGKIDVVASVSELDATKYYSLVTTLTLDGTTKRVSRELGAGKDATYTNTIDCAALFDEEFVGEVSVKLSVEQYATERAVGVVSVVEGVDLTKGEYLIINLTNGSSVETTLGDYLKDHSEAWTLEGGWANDYKTKYLVMRKVKAGVAYPCEPGSWGTISGTMKPAKDYWIGVHQVTVAQYDRVMNEVKDSTDAKPKNNISWNEIRSGDETKTILPTDDVEENSFMGRLCALTGLDDFDLPTEAQWEIAARAGSKEGYGSYVDADGFAQTAKAEDLANIAWFNRNVASPQTVGQLRPNLWGLYDTAGNVEECCRDCNSGIKPVDVESPFVQSEGVSSSRACRGGCYDQENADHCRPSYRDHERADFANDDIGFRLSRICE